MRLSSLLLGLALLVACGRGSDGDGDGDGAAAPRLWDRQLVEEYGGAPGLAVAPTGAVDIVYYGSIDSEHGVVWQEVGGAAELVAATDGVASAPRVARDGGGGVHVVWGDGAAVEYAVRSGGEWTVETIAADRFRPDIAVTAAGVPHVAFVDEETGDARAYHGVRGAAGWEVSPVNPTDWFSESEVGIVLTGDDLPLIGGIDSEREGVWLATADGGGGWTVEELAADRSSTGRLDLATGAAGTALAFKDGSYTVVAWRPAGGDWSVEDASHHDSHDGPIAVMVGSTGPMVASDVDVQYPNGLALLERGSSEWSGQLLSGWQCGDGLAAAVDQTGEPAIAVVCSGGLYYMNVVGSYPTDWSQQCEAAADEMCEGACACGVDGEDCCWGMEGGSTCTSSFGCPINAVAALCGDPTVSPEELQACRDELPSLTCIIDGPLDLSGACAPLYRPFSY